MAYLDVTQAFQSPLITLTIHLSVCTTTTQEVLPVKISLTRTSSWNIGLFPKPVGSTASGSFTDTRVEIALVCSERNSRDIPNGDKHRSAFLRTESKVSLEGFYFSLKCFPACTNVRNLSVDSWLAGINLLAPHRTNEKLCLPVNGVSQANNDCGQAYISSPLPSSLLFLSD